VPTHPLTGRREEGANTDRGNSAEGGLGESASVQLARTLIRATHPHQYACSHSPPHKQPSSPLASRAGMPTAPTLPPSHPHTHPDTHTRRRHGGSLTEQKEEAAGPSNGTSPHHSGAPTAAFAPQRGGTWEPRAVCGHPGAREDWCVAAAYPPPHFVPGQIHPNKLGATLRADQVGPSSLGGGDWSQCAFASGLGTPTTKQVEGLLPERG